MLTCPLLPRRIAAEVGGKLPLIVSVEVALEEPAAKLAGLNRHEIPAGALGQDKTTVDGSGPLLATSEIVAVAVLPEVTVIDD
jgi:hypothetical protein